MQRKREAIPIVQRLKPEEEEVRRTGAGGAPEVTPSLENRIGALRGGGAPLPDSARSFFEPRFGADFGAVRVHSDPGAQDLARSVSARAFTVERNIVFNAGEYSPGTPAGDRLLAHELTHVVQQAGGGTAEDRLHLPEQTPGNIGVQRLMPDVNVIRRTLSVKDPKANIINPGGTGLVQDNATTIENYLKAICKDGSVTVDRGSGTVDTGKEFCTKKNKRFIGIPVPFTETTDAEQSSTPTGCTCICDMVASPHAWTIVVDDGAWPHTNFDDDDAANGVKPGGTGGRVTAPSPNSPKLWGAGAASGKALDIDPWLVLGHELCGHGWLGNGGKHGPDVAKPRGEGGHQAAVARENELRKEHGIELRGTYKDPNCGESYWRDKASPGTVIWSTFRSVCETWRDSYNKANGTKYTILDRIP